MTAEEIKYCGDCLYWRLCRDKEGIVTGEHICVKWDTFHSEWQGVSNCSYFKDKAEVEE